MAPKGVGVGSGPALATRASTRVRTATKPFEQAVAAVKPRAKKAKVVAKGRKGKAGETAPTDKKVRGKTAAGRVTKPPPTDAKAKKARQAKKAVTKGTKIVPAVEAESEGEGSELTSLVASPVPARQGTKRKAADAESDSLSDLSDIGTPELEQLARAVKRVRGAPAPTSTKAATKPARKAAVAKRTVTIAQAKAMAKEAAKSARAVVDPRRAIINEKPTTRLTVWVCGEGSAGELGLGPRADGIDVERPRVNALLSPIEVGVVQVAAGGMHAAALTHDNQVLTWGVNDLGALGRDTAWDGAREVDADRTYGPDDPESSAGGSGLNPREATPTAVSPEHFPDGTQFAQVVASDSATFALTDDGLVYGWGTFRGDEGVLGFSETVRVQLRPSLIPGLKKIKSLACGTNHVLAVNDKGKVFAWDSSQQGQLGRRVVGRAMAKCLVPREISFGRNKIARVACGAWHSFAIDTRKRLWAFGLNTYGQTGIATGAGEASATIDQPTLVSGLRDFGLMDVDGGAHHSLAVDDEGRCLVWGRCDSAQSGIDLGTVPEDDLVFDRRGRQRFIKKATEIPGLKVAHVAAGTDNSFAITTDGVAYSWGFSANYQTGQGTDDDVPIATALTNAAVRGQKLNWAGAGGQFSILTAPWGGVTDQVMED
ncbi:MAG: hypothetical protein M1826_002573 [Phylliscum demangeonii]|nr:MAG: hypothetical protein M1826_002573 [Phylliscum demangeonii]